MSGASDLRPSIRKLVARADLSDSDVNSAFDAILSGSANDAAISAFLVALSMKGVTGEELKMMLAATLRHARRITPRVNGRLIDTCGTGGDSIHSFNISTAAAVVASAAGAKVAKHGNRSMSGICGSADFLEAIGLAIEADPDKVRGCIEATGIGFLFAPVFHPSMKNVVAARKAVGIRTVFNILGPLCNPCTNIEGQVIGVFEPALMDLIGEAYQGRGVDAMIVHAVDGFDEFSNTCDNDVLVIRDGIPPQRLRVHPKVLNIHLAKPEQLVVNSKDDSVRSTLQAIYGKAPPEKEDIVVMNAAASLVISRIASDLKEGVPLARRAIKAGEASAKLGQLVEYSGDIEKLRAAEKKYL
jgi:anthranilate phosphoribosyltransferase